MKWARFIISVYLLILILQSSASYGAVHPSLFYSADDVPALRNPPPGPQAQLKERLRKGALDLLKVRPNDIGYVPDRGNALVALSITCMITDDAQICGIAKRWLMSIVALPSWLYDERESDPDFNQSSHVTGVSVAYDVLSDAQIHEAGRLNSDEQARVRARLAAGGRVIARAITEFTPFWKYTYTQNHHWLNFGTLGLAALVLDGEIGTETTDWLTLVINNFCIVDRVLRIIPDGTWYEGYAYEGASLGVWLRFTAALRRARGPDFTDNVMLRAFPHYRAVASLPGVLHQSILPHGDFFGWSNDDVLYILRYAAVRFGDGEAAWLAEWQEAGLPHTSYGPEQDFAALDYILYNELRAAKVAAVMPNDRELTLTDLQGQISRSGYDANAAVLGLKAGPYLGVGNADRFTMNPEPNEYADASHVHNDDASFWFYANGQWLAPEAAGYTCHPRPCTSNSDPRCINELPAFNTEFHNTFTIDDQGQIGDDVRSKAYRPENFPYNRRAVLVAHTATDNFSYTAIDGTALYPEGLQLTDFSRQVFFLNRQMVVVRDRLLARTAHNYKWHVHAIVGAECDEAIGNNGTQGEVCPSPWIRAVSRNDQALGIRVVTPADWRWDALIQEPCRFRFMDREGKVTRVRIWPATDRPEARFLTVLVPTTVSGWGSRPTIDALGEVSLARGFTINEGNTTGRWLFGDGQDSTVSNGQMTLTGVIGGVQSGGDGTTYVLIRGTTLSADGREILSGDARGGAIEAWVSAPVVYISADGATYARVYAPGATKGWWNGVSVTVYPDPDNLNYVWLFDESKVLR